MEHDTSKKVKGPSIRLSTVASTTRQTPKTDFGTVMRDGLMRAGDVAVEGLKVAAPFVPGSAIVSAALAGGASMANMSIGGGEPSYGSGGIGVNVSGLAQAGPGSGPGSVSGTAAVGSYGSGGTMVVPGPAPGLNTNLSGSPTGFAGNSGVAGNVSGTGDSWNQMMAQTRSMAEFQASFNLQYLQLQEKIQQDTRQFNLVSNIMKTKHEAAKNALNNVR